MKLIDLLVKKTNEEGWGWPGKSTFCYQTRPEHGSITKFFDRNVVKVVDYCWEKCDDASAFNELTKEQYESALAASEDRLEQELNECIGQDVDIPEWSGEWLPPVGVECEYQYKVHGSEWCSFECIAVDGKAAFGWSNNTPIALQSNTHNFRPLRTEAEKSREIGVSEMLKLMYGPQEYNYREICEIIYDAGYRKESK